MAHWNSRGLRGSAFEDCINFTNEQYQTMGLALLQKVPTPITPVQFDGEKHVITLAYFEKQSTVDYIGVAQGIPICFDAKETGLGNLPLQNIHAHQVEFMEQFQKQKGLSFLLVHFSKMDEYYLLPFATLQKFWQAAQAGGRKSIPYDAFDKRYAIHMVKQGVLHYLEGVSLYLKDIENGVFEKN
ncbi:Holliday junction resolvase RecU [Chakrabartyella piscis]|uniref:Holliday junction resolvase RecU n=1 Tax=Chakrabartyella piscis TaxID=2918914 RepID=UPI0029589344|nr:Holliday junction resolvase RecU [Chakrabartyella piscis]